MNKITRKQLRKILEQEKLRTLSESSDTKRKSELKEFAGSKSGANFRKLGGRIRASGTAMRQIGDDQTGSMRARLYEISEFVEKLGSSLEGISNLSEGESITESLPTVAEFKKILKELQRLER
jgi:hypothetical protein